MEWSVLYAVFNTLVSLPLGLLILLTSTAERDSEPMAPMIPANDYGPSALDHQDSDNDSLSEERSPNDLHAAGPASVRPSSNEAEVEVVIPGLNFPIFEGEPSAHQNTVPDGFERRDDRTIHIPAHGRDVNADASSSRARTGQDEVDEYICSDKGQKLVSIFVLGFLSGLEKPQAKKKLRDMVSYYIRRKRIRTFGKIHPPNRKELLSTLCRNCKSLELTYDKFIVPPPDQIDEQQYHMRSQKRAGSGEGRHNLGSLEMIAVKAVWCYFCKLIVNALQEQEIFESWLVPKDITRDMYDEASETRLVEDIDRKEARLSREREELASGSGTSKADWATFDRMEQDLERKKANLTKLQRRRTLLAKTCRVSWQIDGQTERQQPFEENKPRHLLPTDSRRAVTRRIRVECGDDRTIEPAYILLLAGLTESEPDFLGKHVETRRSSISMMRSWLDRCVHEHEGRCGADKGNDRGIRCRSYFGVIDLETWNLTQLPEDAKYVALSYCWGAKAGKRMQIVKTLMGNVHFYKERGAIERIWSKIPNTIRDAMLLARGLGMQYFWVDALCIVQDSEQCWQQNANVMDQVYKHAHFTICAADGKDAWEGLVGLPEVSYGQRNEKLGRQYQQRIQPYDNDTYLMVSYPADYYINKSTWNTRGWTFQERLLSRRCIIFAAGRVFFQCRSLVLREDISADNLGGWSIEHKNTPLDILGDVNRRPLTVYAHCVKLYTKRMLTYPKDILNAFNGVGNHISNVLGNQGLLYGLPRSHFDWALLWQCSAGEDVLYRGKSDKQRKRKQNRLGVSGRQSENEKGTGTAVTHTQHNKHSPRPDNKLTQEDGLSEEKRKEEEEPEEDGTGMEEDEIIFKDKPNPFPTWSWAGWIHDDKSSATYPPDIIDGTMTNTSDWLENHTWIEWYIRDGRGNLTLVWNPEREPAGFSSVLPKRWRGYGQFDGFGKDRDHYGRPICEENRADRAGGRFARFIETLEEFPFPPSVPRTLREEEAFALDRNCSVAETRRFLQFKTLTSYFRVKRFSDLQGEPAVDGKEDRRWAIIDAIDEIRGVIIPDRTEWVILSKEEWISFPWKDDPIDFVPKENREQVRLDDDKPHLFLALSDAKEFSPAETDGWDPYTLRETEGMQWNLFYVMLVTKRRGVYYRLGLGKVEQEAFRYSCSPEPKWKEIILG